MGLFSSKKDEPQVRRDQVMRLIKAHMDETDAADRIGPGCSPAEDRAFKAAKDRLEGIQGQSTKDELRTAYEAAKRHGYL